MPLIPEYVAQKHYSFSSLSSINQAYQKSSKAVGVFTATKDRSRFIIFEKIQTALLCVDRAIERFKYTKREFLKSDKSTEILQVIKLRNSLFSIFVR